MPWVSAKLKRFAWTVGLAMSGAMAGVTNSGIAAGSRAATCLICRTLMWMESALGLCLGCEIHGLLVRRAGDEHASFEVCTHGARAVVPRQASAPVLDRSPA